VEDVRRTVRSHGAVARETTRFRRQNDHFIEEPSAMSENRFAQRSKVSQPLSRPVRRPPLPPAVGRRINELLEELAGLLANSHDPIPSTEAVLRSVARRVMGDDQAAREFLDQHSIA
jgi:hypothetical protein